MSGKGRGPNLFYRPASAFPSLFTYHPSAAPRILTAPPYAGNATRECFYQRSSAAAVSTAGACMRRDSCFILRAPSRNCIARTAAAWWIATRRHFRRRRLVDPPPDRFSLIGNISRDRFLPPDFATTITSVQPTTTHILTAASIYHTLTPTTHHPLNIARAIADYYESRLQPWCIVWLMRKQWKCATTAVKSRTV